MNWLKLAVMTAAIWIGAAVLVPLLASVIRIAFAPLVVLLVLVLLARLVWFHTHL